MGFEAAFVYSLTKVGWVSHVTTGALGRVCACRGARVFTGACSSATCTPGTSVQPISDRTNP